ncbi:hypothetical protein CYLTODRAFT_492823, partial [Cylindrobasidium torrendii FP15055 ss-10]
MSSFTQYPCVVSRRTRAHRRTRNTTSTLHAPRTAANAPSRRGRRRREERHDQLEIILSRLDERIAEARANSVVLQEELARWRERADRLEREVHARMQAKRL